MIILFVLFMCPAYTSAVSFVFFLCCPCQHSSSFGCRQFFFLLWLAVSVRYVFGTWGLYNLTRGSYWGRAPRGCMEEESNFFGWFLLCLFFSRLFCNRFSGGSTTGMRWLWDLVGHSKRMFYIYRADSYFGD